MREVEKSTLFSTQASAEMGSWNRYFTIGRIIYKERWCNRRLEETEPHVDTLETVFTPMISSPITLS